MKCVVSACLLGLECRYDGKAVCDLTDKLRKNGYTPVPACPEQLSGLPTPRECCEIVGGDGFDVIRGGARVLTNSGKDVTETFLKGAKMVYRVCEIVEAEVAFFKDFSPSCGVKQIYDGTFSGAKKKGCGVVTAYLLSRGIEVKKLR